MNAYLRWKRVHSVQSVPVGVSTGSGISWDAAGNATNTLNVTLRRDVNGPDGAWKSSELFRIEGNAEEMEALGQKILEQVKRAREHERKEKSA